MPYKIRFLIRYLLSLLSSSTLIQCFLFPKSLPLHVLDWSPYLSLGFNIHTLYNWQHSSTHDVTVEEILWVGQSISPFNHKYPPTHFAGGKTKQSRRRKWGTSVCSQRWAWWGSEFSGTACSNMCVSHTTVVIVHYNNSSLVQLHCSTFDIFSSFNLNSSRVESLVFALGWHEATHIKLYILMCMCSRGQMMSLSPDFIWMWSTSGWVGHQPRRRRRSSSIIIPNDSHSSDEKDDCENDDLL